MKYKNLAFLLTFVSASLPSINTAYAEGETESSAASAAVTAKAGEDDGLSMFRFAMRMDRLDFVKQAMQLNEEQQNKFLEIYDYYDVELKTLNDERLAIIEDYAAKFDTITDKEADELVKRSLNFRKQRTTLLEKYYDKIAKATSNVIAARFLQVEAVLQGTSDVMIGSSLPLMEK